jgi:hypothetical protein
MSARDDIEHFHAWAKIVFGHLWSDDPPPDYAKIQQEVARLLGSGKPIPPFAEKWLADLRTPRRPGQGREVHADFRPDCRGAQVFEESGENIWMRLKFWISYRPA